MALTKNTISDRTFDFETIFGASFKESVPDKDEWQSFAKNIYDEKALELTTLW